MLLQVFTPRAAASCSTSRAGGEGGEGTAGGGDVGAATTSLRWATWSVREWWVSLWGAVLSPHSQPIAHLHHIFPQLVRLVVRALQVRPTQHGAARREARNVCNNMGARLEPPALRRACDNVDDGGKQNRGSRVPGEVSGHDVGYARQLLTARNAVKQAALAVRHTLLEESGHPARHVARQFSRATHPIPAVRREARRRGRGESWFQKMREPFEMELNDDDDDDISSNKPSSFAASAWCVVVPVTKSSTRLYFNQTNGSGSFCPARAAM